MNRIVILILALALVGCGDSVTDNSRPDIDENLNNINEMIAGSYTGYLSGTYRPGSTGSGYAWNVEFEFTDSNYSWWNGEENEYTSEYGAGPYRVEGDSIKFDDIMIRFHFRSYIVLDCKYRYSFDGEVLTFYREFNDSAFQVFVLEKQ